MYGLIREEYPFPASGKVLARHIYSRMYCGKIVIVTNNPKIFLSPLRKQWIKLTHKVQIERARTLDGARISELTSLLVTMQTMQFKASWHTYDPTAHIHLATPEQLLAWAPECGTLYVVCDVRLEDLHRIAALMRGLVVVYKS